MAKSSLIKSLQQPNTPRQAIEHQFAPLAEAFGTDSLPWSIGLLEGFYQTGFSHAGAGKDLSVRFATNENDGLRLVFKLATRH